MSTTSNCLLSRFAYTCICHPYDVFAHSKLYVLYIASSVPLEHITNVSSLIPKLLLLFYRSVMFSVMDSLRVCVCVWMLLLLVLLLATGKIAGASAYTEEKCAKSNAMETQ